MEIHSGALLQNPNCTRCEYLLNTDWLTSGTEQRTEQQSSLGIGELWGKKTPKIKKQSMKSTNIGCSGHLIVFNALTSALTFLFATAGAHGPTTAQARVVHRLVVPHTLYTASIKNRALCRQMGHLQTARGLDHKFHIMSLGVMPNSEGRLKCRHRGAKAAI